MDQALENDRKGDNCTEQIAFIKNIIEEFEEICFRH